MFGLHGTLPRILGSIDSLGGQLRQVWGVRSLRVLCVSAWIVGHICGVHEVLLFEISRSECFVTEKACFRVQGSGEFLQEFKNSSTIAAAGFLSTHK